MKTLLICLMIFFSYGSIAEAEKNYEKEPKSTTSRSAEDTTENFRYISFTDKSDWQSIPLSKAGNHALGSDIARKFYLFRELYTYKTPVSPGSPAMRTVIRKPVVYNALSKLDKHLRKAKHQKSPETFSSNLEHALDVAIAVYSQESGKLESALQSTNDAEDIISVFSRVELVKY